MESQHKTQANIDKDIKETKELINIYDWQKCVITIPKLLHFVQLSCTHKSAALRIANERRALTHPVTTL